ncbi:MAG: 50S ribosome-binding GTPase [Candidatus Lokiarchaeota archaeon]|nr:50S ribosome-binding GTPase [Candidatus Lokiarchaeota archaeon]
MEEFFKVIIAGLDNAGKTSILTALDKKYDFDKEIVSLKPTIRVEYHATQFLKNRIVFWDMGGQTKFRELYKKKQDLYFAGTDLMVYIIDIQDEERFNISLEYLDSILHHFMKNKLDIPLIISFHKYDPEIRGKEKTISIINDLKEGISQKYPSVKILFQLTSIYDIISIVQLISYGLSIFDDKFYDLSELLEKYLNEFNCSSLIVFDKNGIIISEYYSEFVELDLYTELIESIKHHLFLLKRMLEESYEADYNFSNVGANLLSYLHRLKIAENSLFISVIIKESLKDEFLEKFTDFLNAIEKILTPLLT